MQPYCMKSLAKKEMIKARAITTKNGESATWDVCPSCGPKMLRMGKVKFRDWSTLT